MSLPRKPILRALNGQKPNNSPLWIMRQAGRYLPEYRNIRKKADFLTMCHTPELACEVTLQPIKRFKFDAAILFSDILIPLMPMGFQLHFEESKGPIISNPVRSEADIKNLKIAPKESCGFVGKAIGLILNELDKNTTLIGFAGAPFTLASYAVEGRSSKNFSHIKSFMYSNPKSFHKLLHKITQTIILYCQMQIEAGAEVIQLFDSWAAALPPSVYQSEVLPYTKKILDAIKQSNIPSILFARGNPVLLSYSPETSASGIGIGWESDIQQAAAAIGPNFCLQGNFDPALLLTSPEVVKSEINLFFEKLKPIPNTHIFNLGHGILPQTPVENVFALADAVRSR